MSSQFRLEIYDRGVVVHKTEILRAVELGRQESPQEPLFVCKSGSVADRIVFAPFERNTISRRHLHAEPLAQGRLRITNLGARYPLALADGSINPGESREFSLPCELSFAGYRLSFLPGAARPNVGASPPTAATAEPVDDLPSSLDLASVEPEQAGLLVTWLQAIIRLLQSAAHSEDFFQRAATAIVDLIGLDSGRVLLYETGKWNVVASHAKDLRQSSPIREPSRRVLEQMRLRKQTKTRRGAETTDIRGSLIDIEAVVATPILDRQGEPIGALYGDRIQSEGSKNPPQISRADVMLLETLASGVGAGLARVEHEQAALEARVRFEQFFTPDLAQQLANDPNLLVGRDTEVTLLFCDIRGFSAVAERLGAARTMQWINDVLGTLSDCVLKNHGVLVDYTGDELFAMWGAPVEQPNHAELACRTAIEMWRSLPAVSDRWRERICGETQVGIGINTGLAHVGNIGSARKFKYGALGNAVNLSSRVQGATKYMRTGILMTEQTRSRMPDTISTRRLCSVHVVNIGEPITLYELQPAPDATWPELCRRYEQALAEFEQQHFDRAMVLLCELLSQHPGDGPSLVLLSRLVPLLDNPRQFNAVWELPGK